MSELVLLPHPETPAPWVVALTATAKPGEGGLVLRYRLVCDRRRLALPARASGGRADGLWRHTCFEAFIQGADAPAYREFNFSPDGRWQAYAFAAYRQGGPLEPAPAPGLAWNDGPDGLALEARLATALLPRGARPRLGLTAVLEDGEGDLSYWALAHPPGRPDFHHPLGLALVLDMNVASATLQISSAGAAFRS